MGICNLRFFKLLFSPNNQSVVSGTQICGNSQTLLSLLGKLGGWVGRGGLYGNVSREDSLDHGPAAPMVQIVRSKDMGARLVEMVSIYANMDH